MAFLAETAAAVSPCDGADDVLRGVCHLVMILIPLARDLALMWTDNDSVEHSDCLRIDVP